MKQMSKWIVSLVFVVAACSQGAEGQKKDPSLTAAASASNAVKAASSAASSAHPSGSAVASASASAAGESSSWKGSFKTKVAAVTPPKEAAVEVWAKDPGTVGIGDATITLTTEPTPNGKFQRVVGEIKGALGDLVVSGTLDADGLAARVDPKDPKAPPGFAGTLTGKGDSSKIEATLRVSNRDANLVREATFSLMK